MTEILNRKTLKALSADTRQDIVKLVSQRPHTISELAKKTGKHVTTVKEHVQVLEKAELIEKRPSTNKWVYYTLTGKGEKLFKPKYYSWVVVLSLSVVLMFTGFLRMFQSSAQTIQTGAAKTSLAETGQSAIRRAAENISGEAEKIPLTEIGKPVTDKILEEAPNIVGGGQGISDVSIVAAGTDIIGIMLIVLALIGFAYVAYKMWKRKATVKNI